MWVYICCDVSGKAIDICSTGQVWVSPVVSIAWAFCRALQSINLPYSSCALCLWTHPEDLIYAEDCRGDLWGYFWLSGLITAVLCVTCPQSTWKGAPECRMLPYVFSLKFLLMTTRLERCIDRRIKSVKLDRAESPPHLHTLTRITHASFD